MNEIHWLNAITLDWASVGSSPATGKPTSPVGTSGSGTIIIPPGESISNPEDAATGLSESGKSMITKDTGNGISLGLAEDGNDAEAADQLVTSAVISIHGLAITLDQDSALYLLISLSIITPNLAPSSTIIKESGFGLEGLSGIEGSPHQRSNSHAERCPIPPPTSMALPSGTRDTISLILLLSDRVIVRSPINSICSPIEEAISGSVIFTRTRCQISLAGSKALSGALAYRVDFHLQ